MQFRAYGLFIVVAAGALIPLVTRLRRRLTELPEFGWGKVYLGLVFFLATGFFQSLLSIPSFMNLFLPAVANWFAGLSQITVVLGLVSILWGVANIVSSVRQIQDQKSDDEEWRSLYLQLQDLSQQPFSFVEILNLGLNQLLKRSEADGAAVMLYKENSAELILAAFSNLPPDTAKKFELLKVTGDIFGRAQKLGRVQNVANLSDADRGTEELFAGSGFLSAAVFPLRSRDKVLGSAGLFSAKPLHFHQKRIAAITVAVNHLANQLESVRNEKEMNRLKDRLKPSEEAKRITEELFFRRGIGSNLELREAVEFERVRRFFDADCIKLVFCDRDGEHRIKASSGGAETGLLLDKRKLTGITRAVSERKLLLLTSPTSTPAGGGFDSMPRQTLFIPVPYPDREDLVLLLESERASLEFSEEKLSAVRVASVYLADLHFLFLAKRDGDRYRNSLLQIDQSIGNIVHSGSRSQLAAALGESCANILPNCRGRVTILSGSTGDDDLLISDSAGLALSSETDWIRYSRFLNAMRKVLLENSEEELRTTKSVLLTRFPVDLRDRFERVFAPIPEKIQQMVIPVRFRGESLGVVGLYFSENDPPSRESVELYRRLVELAAIALTANSPSPKTEDDTVSSLESIRADEHRSLGSDKVGAPVDWFSSDKIDIPLGSAEKTRPLSILGIDDQEVIRDLLSNIISRMGHRIVTSGDGHEGLRFFKEGQFDLVIIEAGLPNMNGWDIAAQVKSLSPLTPVIMLAGWGPQSDEQTVLQRNADFVLTKPFKMDQLGQVIGAACKMIPA